MTNTHAVELGLVARLVIGLAILLFVAGVLWHGVTYANLQRLWGNLIERPSGPMSFRFILQPCMAAIAAIHDGRQDAQIGRSPYFWAILRERGERAGRLREGLNATARTLLIGLVMDVVYQMIVLKMFYPVEALLIALLLAFCPYLILRGLVARAVRWSRPRGQTGGDPPPWIGTGQ